MKRKDLLAEISRENTMRRSVFPRWIQIKKISKEVAERRLRRTEMIESILNVMTDEEFTQLANRLEIRADHEQGSLF